MEYFGSLPNRNNTAVYAVHPEADNVDVSSPLGNS